VIWIRDLERLIRRTVSRVLSEDLHTMMPVKVVSYDSDENKCSVQPCITRIRTNDPNNLTTIQLPVLDDVPVHQFGSGKCLFAVAPQVGSYGSVWVSERSLEKWLTDGGIGNPNSARKFDISDAVFYPGLYPFVTDGDNGKLQSAIATDRISMRTRTNDTSISVIDNDNVSVDTTGDVDITCTTCNVSDKLVVNSDSDAAALASKVDSLWSTFYSMFFLWVPSPNDGGAALKAKFTEKFPGSPATVASNSLKVDQ
jgi:hypothetical protein